MVATATRRERQLLQRHIRETPPAPNGYAPTYPCRAILPDGRMLVEGGEYMGTNPVPVETNQGAVYDPVTDSWASVTPPPGATQIGDRACTVMPNGKLLLASRSGATMYELDPASMTWTVLTPSGKLNNSNTEENWTLLPDGTILTVDVRQQGSAERYIPPWLSGSTNGEWISAGKLPTPLSISTGTTRHAAT